MKNQVALFLFLLISITAFSQNMECEITFNDGQKFKGFGEISKKDKIIFRRDKNGSAKSYGPDIITKIVFSNTNESRTFEYVRVKSKRKKAKFLLMEEIENGKITLLQHYNSRLKSHQNGGGVWGGDNNFPNPIPTGEVVHEIEKYLKVNSSTIAISLNDPSTIKEVLADCFEGCPLVLNELEVVELKGDNIDDLVWQYNRECSEDTKEEE